MAFTEISEENYKIFKERVTTSNLGSLKFRILDTDKITDAYKFGVVIINNEAQRSAYGEDFIIIINENIFDNLTDMNKLIYVDRLLAKVGYDAENDTIKNNTPDVKEHSSVLLSYKYNNIYTMKVEVSQILAKLKEEQKEKEKKKK